MTFYRVTFYNTFDGTAGYSWHTSKASASKSSAEWIASCDGDATASAEIEAVEITPTKQGILDALNTYAKHADNG